MEPPALPTAHAAPPTMTGPEIDDVLEKAYTVRFGQPEDALRTARAAAAAAEALGDERRLAYALRTSGAIHGILWNPSRALADLRRAGEIFSRTGDEVGSASVQAWTGFAYRKRGEFARAMEHYIIALKQFTAAGSFSDQADVLNMIGGVKYLLSEYREALELYGAARRLALRANDPRALMRSLNNLGSVYSTLTDHEEGLRTLEEALELARALGEELDVMLILANLGTCCADLARDERAREYFETALHQSRERGAREVEAGALAGLGRTYRASGDLPRALALYEAAVEVAGAVADHHKQSLYMIALGSALVEDGQCDRALTVLDEARALCERLGLASELYEAHQSLANAYEAAGDPAAALRQYRLFHQLREKVLHANRVSEQESRHAVAEIERLHAAAELQELHSKLQLLKAQLDPHFLFNVLNSVSALVRRDPLAADRMICAVAALLRMAIRQSSSAQVELREEIEFVAAYLDVERMRYGRRVEVSIAVPPELLPLKVPHLILQPLVENVLKHALGVSDERVSVDITGVLEDEHLVLSVRDTGTGVPEEWRVEDSTGVGLTNTRKRLQGMYGALANLEIAPAPPRGTLARLTIPMRGQADRRGG